MGMRQYGGDSELVVEQPSTEDLTGSHCGSKLNLLEAGSRSLHYSNTRFILEIFFGSIFGETFQKSLMLLGRPCPYQILNPTNLTGNISLVT